MASRKNLILGIAAFIVLLIGYNAIFRWPAEKQALAKQDKLIAAIEARKWGRVQRLTSENYSDSLGLDRENLILAVRDLGSQFWTQLDLNWEMTELKREGISHRIDANILM